MVHFPFNQSLWQHPVSVGPGGHTTHGLLGTDVPTLAADVEAETREHVALELVIALVFVVGVATRIAVVALTATSSKPC